MKKIILLLLISVSVYAQQPKVTKPGYQDFSLIVSVEDQEKQYNDMLKVSPVDAGKPSMYEEYRAQLALGWLSKGNFERYWYYKNTNPKFNVLQLMYLVYAMEYILDADKNTAELEKVSGGLLKDIETGVVSDPIGRAQPIMEINAAVNARLGNIEKAEKMLAASSGVKGAMRDMKYFRDAKANYLNRYAIVMSAAGKDQMAFDTLTKAFRDAETKPVMVTTFRQVYKKLKGTENGFEKYLESLQKEAYQECYNEVKKSYITSPQKVMDGFFPNAQAGKQPMKLFQAKQPVDKITLTDLNGKSVQLGDYKGKVLALDFWTTLCTPCVAAFSGFDRVVADYKKDKFQMFVVNLFEDLPTVKSFIAKKGITLNVLRDEENAAYDIQGTPTKIVFDPSGNIRFYSAGYSGSTDREFYKLKAMVEIAGSVAKG